MGRMERSGELRARKMERLTGESVEAEVKANVKPGAVVLTDEAKGYTGLQGTDDHYAVNHGVGEYVRLFFIHTNEPENDWSLFKRQVYGIHHWISAKHVDCHLGEFTFRYDGRKVGEGERVNTFLGRVEGRLTYKGLIA